MFNRERRSQQWHTRSKRAGWSGDGGGDDRRHRCDLPVAFNDSTGRWMAKATDLYMEKTTTTMYRIN